MGRRAAMTRRWRCRPGYLDNEEARGGPWRGQKRGAAVARACAVAYLFGQEWKRREGSGDMVTLFQALMLILDILWFIMIAHIIMSWLINFNVLNLRQPLVAQIWTGLSNLLEPIYAPIRRVLPQTGGLDLAPLVVFVIIIIAKQALANNAGFFLGY